MLKKASLPFIAFLQASGLVAYVILISSFFTFAGSRLDHMDSQVFPGVLFLLLFILSATISATLVLGRAGVLFWEKRYKEAFKLLGWTVGWGVLYFLLLLSYIYFRQ